MQKELSMFGSWFMVFLNFWLVLIRVERFLARGNECFGSWWLVVGRGGSCVVLESTHYPLFQVRLPTAQRSICQFTHLSFPVMKTKIKNMMITSYKCEKAY